MVNIKEEHMRNRKKSGTELQNKLHAPHIKSRKGKNKKVINGFSSSTFTERLMVMQGNFSYQEKDTVQNKDKGG